MMIMTAKVNPKKWIAIALAAAAAGLGLLLLLRPGETGAPAAAAQNAASNEDRLRFLSQLGWEAAAAPVQSGQVKIPEKEDPVFSRYNELQKSLGYDLSPYAGQICDRYVYKIRNFPGAAAPVYATLLICHGQVIGGDLTDTSPRGQVHGLRQAGKDAPTVPSVP